MPNVTQYRFAVILFHWPVAPLFVVWVLASTAQAQPAQAAKPISITGVYNGGYPVEKGPVKFKLSITQQDTGTLAGAFTLYLPDGSATKEYTCPVGGRYIQAVRMVQLVRVGNWDNPPPDGIVMVGMNGVFDPNGGNGAGQISGKMRSRPEPEFQAVRDADESAKMADEAAAKRAAVAPVAPVAPPARRAVASTPATPPAPVAPPARQPVAANRAAPRPTSPPPPAAPAPAPNAVSPTAINGAYTGEFQRPVGNSKLKMLIRSTEDGALTALFTFDPPNRRIGPSTTFKLTGRFDPTAHDQWGNKIEPFQFTTIEAMGSGAQKALDALKAQAARIAIGSPGSINGKLFRTDPGSGESNCGNFNATKDRNQPADFDQTMLAQAGAATAPPAPVARLPFEGVYNGTYAGKQTPETKFKLKLWLEQQHKTAAGKVVRTDIAGLLTIFPSDDSGTLPCTCELRGFYGDTSRVIQLTSRGWEPRIPSVPLMNGLEGKFDSASGQISGSMTHPTSPTFHATKDAAESASMDVERLRDHIYPHIVGVFNGTYTRENETPTKFKLTVKHNGDGPAGLEGLATIYLPSGSGTKPYTYDLKGVETSHGEFQLQVHDWVSTPPSDFKNFRGMGFNGKVIVNDAVTTAKLISVPPAASVASDYLPQFEATWDPTESTDLTAVIIAQKAVGKAEEGAALKARDEMIRNAPPKELASKDLVRKSRKYWDFYRHDMIREVFDGGFGAAIDENKEFQKVFCTYVEMFAAKCPECLPPDHVRVTNIVRTNRKFDKNGTLISEENHDYTVDMDPRFEAGYKRCWAAVNSKSEALAGVVAAAQPGGVQHVLYDLKTLAADMQRFFAEHGGKSAAMRQMTENFVRAVHGDPSLQQAGGKIDGAEAESDKDLPPGKYARFVDGANAYFREKAKREPSYLGNSASHDTALCQRMAERFEFYMKPEEEYYYANDFAGRFIPIMGPRASCPDPAWPTFHPDVEKAIAEVK